MAAVVITYRTKSAIRDVGKALGLSLDRVDALTKHVEGRELGPKLTSMKTQLQGTFPSMPKMFSRGAVPKSALTPQDRWDGDSFTWFVNWWDFRGISVNTAAAC